MQVRPYNIDRTVNLRELSPSDVDQLITIKGLVIRSSPVIPDMRAGKNGIYFLLMYVIARLF